MSLPVITVEQMRRWEATSWKAGKSEAEVIARVGSIVSKRALELTQLNDKILLIAGKGHNGDDVRAMINNLPDRDVTLIEVIDPGNSLEKLLINLSAKPKLIIDGLFGIGINRVLEEDWINFISEINAQQLRVLSVDIPSGIDATTGKVQGAAIRANETLTLGAPKIGLLNSASTDYVGRLRVAPEIGLVKLNETSNLQLNEAEDFSNFPPPRSVNGHKGTFGHVGIVGGSLGYHGAAVLAARAASRSQPGLVTLMTPEEVFVPVASQLQSVMVHPLTPNNIEFKLATALLIGPGMAAEGLNKDIKEKTNQIWHDSPMPILVDASALDWITTGEITSKSIRVITPHPGEAARLLGCTAADIQADREKALQALSAKFGDCWVVLKGRHTLVGQSKGTVFVNPTGNSSLGQGGSGDLLAGYLAGLLAQPLLQENVVKTLSYGIWQHGAAADKLNDSKLNWTIEDLSQQIGGTKP